MARLNTLGKVLWGFIAAVVVAALVVVLLYTQTDWGRRHVLALGLEQLASRVHGYVTIKRLHGNLLTGARLDSVVITDSARRPFLAADTLELRYSLRSLIAKHLVFSDVRMVHGTVVLDKPPGEEWNFSRLFPTGPPTPRRGPGFGSWVLIENTTVERSTFMVRNAWSPPDSLRGRARDSAIAAALSPANRLWIVPVPRGYQALSVFGAVNAYLPVMRLADPDSANRLIDIARLAMIAFPFRPPAAIVRDMRARVVITKDSLLFDSVGLVLPGTRAGGLGGYALNGNGARVQLALRPFTFRDAAFLYPDIPAGGGRMGLAFTSHEGRTHIVASSMDLRSGTAVVAGLADFQLGPSFFRAGPSNVAYAGVDTRLLKQYLPALPLKVGGTLAGELQLRGAPADMQVGGWTEFRERGGPTSKVVADGRVGSGTGGFQARGLRLRFEPLYLSLVRGYAPNVPYRGRVTGQATLTGSSSTGFALAANLVDADPSAGRSHLIADGRVAPRNGVTAHNLRLRFDPLQVALLRPFAPGLPVGGTITGSTTLNGSTRSRMDVAADLVHTAPATGRSHVLASGGIQLAGGVAARGLRLRFEPLQMALVKRFAPRLRWGGTLAGTTTLTGSPARGFDVVADVTHVDPRYGRSRVAADGRIGFQGGLTADNLRLRFDPVQVALARPYVKDLPYGGTLTGTTTLTGSTSSRMAVVANLVHVDPKIGRSHVTANGGVRFAGGFAASDLRLGFEPLQVAALKPFVPKLPYAGVLTGTTTLTGSTRSGFDLVANVTHVDPSIGRSHVEADGYVRLAGGLATRGLRLRLEPLQLAALRPFMPNLPVEGSLAGRTNVTFSAGAKQFAAIMDLEHRGPTGYSHVIGNADASWRAPGYFGVNVRAPALSLATVGAFMPSTGLRGAASGDIVARGNLANLTTDVRLAVVNGGAFDLHGMLDLAAREKRYDIAAGFDAFNAGAVTTHAPQTALNGTLVARGAGTDPATMNAFLDANLVDSRGAGSPRLDTALVRARVAGGLASFERGHVRLGSALADVSGSFGLTAARSGTLNYFLRVDTLSQFANHIPLGTGTVAPRPLLQERRMARARADSARLAAATEVQRAAVGYPSAPTVKPDTLPLRRDTLAGSFASRGTLTGNLKRFDARGTAQARDFSFGANYIGAGSATYSLLGYGTPNPLVHLDAFADTVSTGGFAFDSARAKVDYNGLTGTGYGHADVSLFQDPARDYRVVSDFNLALPRRQLALQNVLLRFDTTTWRSTHPSTIGWGKPGITVQNLELLSSTGGYLRANGRLPSAGSADLRLDVEGLQVGDITALLQDTASLRGIASLHARVQGTSRSPVIAGTAGLVRATWGGNPFPDVRATLSYANTDLRANTQFFQGPLMLAVADVRLPVNLALSGVTGPRLLRDRALQVDMRADSLPLEALPSFTTAVSEVRGRVRGTVAVRGTFDNPTTNGTLLLDLGSLRVASTGVLYNNITGTVRLQNKTAHVDSIVAHGGGVIRTTGTVDLSSLARPSFDLAIASNDASVLDNKWGRIRADMQLAVKGPYTGLGVTGDATITGGVIYAPEMQNQHATNLEDPTLAGVVDTLGRGLNVLPAPNPLLQNLVVDVGLRIDPDTWVRNSKANVEIYTPLDAGPLRVHMDNAHQRLSLLGTINSDRGEYTYSGRVFNLSTGSATFMGGPTINPLLQLTAIYNVQRRGQEALAIQISVDGTLSKPRVTLQSNAQPPLSQSDLLSYLAFGQPASSLLSLQTSPGLTTGGPGALTGIPGLFEQQIASLALGAMVEQTVSDIQEQGTRAGLDVFRVHPGELPAEAAFQGYFRNFLQGTEIEAGKYLSSRTFVELRGRTSTLPGVLLEYREPFGFTWTTTWEPRYLPAAPSFSTVTSAQRRAFGTFLLWSRRY